MGRIPPLGKFTLTEKVKRKTISSYVFIFRIVRKRHTHTQETSIGEKIRDREGKRDEEAGRNDMPKTTVDTHCENLRGKRNTYNIRTYVYAIRYYLL